MTEQSYPSFLHWPLVSFKFQLKDFFVILTIKHVSSEKLVLSRDQFSNYLKQHDEKTPSANCFIEVHIVNMIKESKFNWCSSHAELLQFSLKKDLVNNGCSLFAEEVIS